MAASDIIYSALTLVHDESHNGVFFCNDSLWDMATDCVEEIRNEFKKAGIDPWKEVKNEDPEEALHDQPKHPEG